MTKYIIAIGKKQYKLLLELVRKGEIVITNEKDYLSIRGLLRKIGYFFEIVRDNNIYRIKLIRNIKFKEVKKDKKYVKILLYSRN